MSNDPNLVCIAVGIEKVNMHMVNVCGRKGCLETRIAHTFYKWFFLKTMLNVMQCCDFVESSKLSSVVNLWKFIVFVASRTSSNII